MTTTQSSTKFQVVHIKLSESDEKESKRLSKIIFPYLQMMSGDYTYTQSLNSNTSDKIFSN